LLLHATLFPLPSFTPKLAYASAPAGPVGCATTTTTVTQSTPTAVPTGPAVVSSTLVVSGLGTYLADVDVQTFLTHTFSADIDMTIMSPAGTIVTLTTDNGAGNDNTFNGTVWDDDANADGQVPYTANNGLVTDHTYVNLTTASPLVPEEALGAFIGENPNGTWTMTISDDLAGDGGSLDSWSLTLTTAAAAFVTTNTNHTQSTPTAVIDTATVSSTLVVSGLGTYLADVDVQTFLTHTFGSDLDMTIMSPAGTIVTLTTDNGAGNDNTFNGTVWDDSANPDGQVPYTTNNGIVTDHAYVNLTTASPLVPEEALAAFIGEDPNGTWTFTISDDLAGDSGSLDSWSLDITTASSCTEIETHGNGHTIAHGDTTPDALDLTDFGTIRVGQLITHTFTISNTGVGDLLLTGANPVSLASANPFSVSVQPSSPVLSNGSTTFVIAFTPLAAGSFTDTVSIANNDSDESPYTFVVGGTAILAPEIAILGNDQEIVSGDTTPAPTDLTDFGSVILGQSLTNTFIISNTGNADLILTASSLVTITGSADFSLVAVPITPVAPDTETSFQIAFTPSSLGVKNATISIANNDSDENPTTFAIQGLGVPVPLSFAYLPIVSSTPALPDLIVEQINTSNGRLEVTIKNIGQAATTEAFWVDVYINPRSAPTGVNEVWQFISDRGLVWGVTAPIAAGGSLTLTVNDAYFNAELSSQGGAITPGTRLYAQVDSAYIDRPEGGVLETHERDGGTYNNISTANAATTIAALVAAPTFNDTSAMPARPK
jgi:subtilisin-like proprotein convertase family protein